MTQQLLHAARPKNLPKIWLWRIPKRCKAVGLMGENSEESLLAREFVCSGRSLDTLERVPKGFLAVYVGPDQRRYVIPTSYLSLPEFEVLMERAAEEFDFQHDGGLRIPCDEEDFEEVLLRCVRKYNVNKSKRKKLILGVGAGSSSKPNRFII